ncbi:hypothetical protein MNEG_6033 [Monoraphidium neglectum]|uniref:Methyltransferase type 11 domain-containing protein n=1 Tax=Monoraphidium neglectum TaxID=145388 RepID=A0A0D2MFL9_9CHLO|nr:hypothetical protein MNEG_6033 [Monoraphidium neglectum]KIZ01930.1 hypothetical protein MNEG_6033 [Monoraphidium neglectum]|eukprot:XP_013900949.1 hypothetical protein MNEG_6033 [Monoraphidium neglectum]
MPQFADDAFGTVVDKGTLDAVLCSGTGLGDVRCYVSETHRVLSPGGVFLLISLGQPETRLSVLRAQPRKRRPSSADGAVAPPPVGAAALGLPQVPPPSTLSARLAARVAAAAETAAASPAALANCAGAGRREVRWARVSVYLLPKPSLYLRSEAALLGRQLPGLAAGGAPPLPVGKDEPSAWLGPYEVGPELQEALAAPGLDPRDYFYAYACVKAGAGCARRSSSQGLATEQGPVAGAAALVAAACTGAAAPDLPPVQRAASIAAALCHSASFTESGAGGGASGSRLNAQPRPAADAAEVLRLA